MSWLRFTEKGKFSPVAFFFFSFTVYIIYCDISGAVKFLYSRILQDVCVLKCTHLHNCLLTLQKNQHSMSRQSGRITFIRCSFLLLTFIHLLSFNFHCEETALIVGLFLDQLSSLAYCLWACLPCKSHEPDLSPITMSQSTMAWNEQQAQKLRTISLAQGMAMVKSFWQVI